VITVVLTITISTVVVTAIVVVVVVVVAAVRGGGVVAAIVVVVASVVVVTITTDSKVNGVIDGPTLGNRHENTLMVRSGGDGRDPVCTRRKATGDIGSELTVDSNIVETLEESKDPWICGLRRVKGWDRFNHNVVVSDNLSTAVQLLGRSKVRRVGIGKVTGLHSFRIQGNSEWGVGVNVTTVGRELKLAGGHVVDTRNITHRRRVARATLNLQAICDGLANTEIDEVVRANEGVCLTIPRAGTIDILNNRGVQSKGGLRVPVVVIATILVVVSVLVVVTVGLVVIPTFHAVAVLTGHQGMRLRNDEGSRELGHNKENKRESDALHD